MRNDLVLTPWTILHDSDAVSDAFPESVFFSGNGRFGVRGYIPVLIAPRPVERGLFLAGIFGEIKPGITDFVNLPTPVYQRVVIDGVEADSVTEIHREFDLQSAVIRDRYTVNCGEKSAELTDTIFFPCDHPTFLLQRTTIKPIAGSTVELISGIETDSCNSPIPDDQMKSNTEHISLAEMTVQAVGVDRLHAEFSIRGNTLTVSEDVLFSICGEPAQDACGFGLRFKNIEVVDKLSCIRSSRDVSENREVLPDSWDFDELLAAHKGAWAARWKNCDLSLDDAELQIGLRYSMYQLMASCSRSDPTVSIGARGLTHARYKGCYFWDTDMFMLPFFLKNDPTAARNLCQYRVNALDAARKHSASMNTKGARYPWMASLDGSEQCETWDIGCSELHITADIVYALDQYIRTSSDERFYLDSAAEVYVETARFWMSRYSYRPEAHRADLLWCKGPDEYCGVSTNNLYTNVMVQHNLRLACIAAEDLKARRNDTYKRLEITDTEVAAWDDLRRYIPHPHDPVTGHLTTDDLFHLLEPVDVKTLKRDDSASYHEICFDRLQRYRVVKQADVLLLMTRLPHLFTEAEKRQAWDDFEPICLHDSTLSFASHALFALQNNMTEAGMAYLRKALLLDLRDVMGNTGKEGLHLACMGEAWHAATYVENANTLYSDSTLCAICVIPKKHMEIP